MLLLLPTACFVLLFFWRVSGGDRSVRASLLTAAVLWAVLLVISTELFSALHAIHAKSIAAFWAAASLSLCAVLLLTRRKQLRLTLRFPALDLFDKITISLLSLFIVILCVIAFMAPPNNWDSMTYHMSRVMHWIQNNSLAMYPTNILRQLYNPPGAEMAILHTIVLSGGDRFANLVQLFSLAGIMIGASLITRYLGGGRRGLRPQLFAAVFAATLPMAILQATNTQNDLVASLWLVCFLVFALRFRDGGTWLDVFCAGAAIGLALLTKGTVLMFAPPFILLAPILIVLTPIARKNISLGQALVVASVVALMIIAPHFTRTQKLFNSPLGPAQSEAGDFRVTNERLTPAIIAANIIRNTGMHLGGPIKPVNAFTETVIRKILGSEIENPQSTWVGSRFHVRPEFHEDVAGNFLAVLIIALTFALMLTKGFRHKNDLLLYAAALVLAFLLFCIQLKWQPFHSRLQLPLFMLAAPLCATVLSKALPDRLVRFLMILLLAGGLPWLVLNKSRPIIGHTSVLTTPRTDQCFVNQPGLGHAYRQIATELALWKPASIGLAWNEDGWEYPLWVLLKNTRIEHVLVDNRSGAITDSVFRPDLILATRPIHTCGIGRTRYAKIAELDGIEMLLPEN
ncbi:MAG: glycosyltransferase family 39 protein [Chitinispirillaceae bacterium]|jgi:hypothetical protein|nr:glycosyltransferase family 39 protein [Chitinispirillaceae bacterium]